MEQEFEKRMTEARKEGQEIIAQATQMSEKAREEISRERDLAMAELRQQVADLSLVISEKVIGATLDEQRQRQLIAEFLEQTEELK